MKKILLHCFVIILSIVATLSFIGCSNVEDAVIEQYVGKWYCYKIENEEKILYFGTLPVGIDAELSIEFFTDKMYVCHFYVNGQEGKAYPQDGTFSVSDNSLLLSGEISGVAEISGSDMVLTVDGLTQYYQRNAL